MMSKKKAVRGWANMLADGTAARIARISELEAQVKELVKVLQVIAAAKGTFSSIAAHAIAKHKEGG